MPQLTAEDRERCAGDLQSLERITGQFLLFAGGGDGEASVEVPLEQLLAEVAAMVEACDARVVWFGAAGQDISVTDASSRWPDRLRLTIREGGRAYPVKMRLVGEHWTTSVLAAVTTARQCGLEMQQCLPALEQFDVVREAGGANRTLVREVRGVKAAEALTVTFKARRGTPSISGLEVVAE